MLAVPVSCVREPCVSAHLASRRGGYLRSRLYPVKVADREQVYRPRLGGTCPSHNCERGRHVERNTQRTGLRTTESGNSGSDRTSRLRDLAHTAGWQLGGELEQGGGGSGELSVRQLSGWRPLADEPDVVSEVLLARLVRT